MNEKVICYRGSIVVYYTNKQKTVRLSTGVKISKTEEKYFKNGVLSAKVDDFENKNKSIKIKLKRIHDLVDEYYIANQVYPPVEYIKGHLGKVKEKIMVSEKQFVSFEEYYKIIFDEKKTRSIQKESLKDYKSTLNALLLYQHVKANGVLTLNKMNTEDFLIDFEKFLSTRQDEKYKKKFKTIGGLNNNTVKKRISTTLTFMKECEKKEFIIRKKAVEHYVSDLKGYNPTIVIITREERKQLLDLDLNGEEEKMRDILIFLCLTGMRYSDLITLSKDHIINGYIVKVAHKSRKPFKVPLSVKATDIINKYNCNFNLFTTAQFNLGIKELLPKYNICTNKITIENTVFNNIKTVEVLKYKSIGTHSGRRSFVAACISHGYTVPVIMGFTGHKNISSFQCYVNQFQEQENAIEKIKMLD